MRRPTLSRTARLDNVQSTASDTPTEPLLVSEPRAAEMLGISERTLWSLAASGEVPFLKIRTRKLYDVRDLVAWINAQKRKGGGCG